MSMYCSLPFSLSDQDLHGVSYVLHTWPISSSLISSSYNNILRRVQLTKLFTGWFSSASRYFRPLGRLLIRPKSHYIFYHFNTNVHFVKHEQAAVRSTRAQSSPASREEPCDVFVIDVQNLIDRYPHARVEEPDDWSMREGCGRLQATMHSVDSRSHVHNLFYYIYSWFN
jgi:hypothetical protein